MSKMNYSFKNSSSALYSPVPLDLLDIPAPSNRRECIDMVQPKNCFYHDRNDRFAKYSIRLNETYEKSKMYNPQNHLTGTHSRMRSYHLPDFGASCKNQARDWELSQFYRVSQMQRDSYNSDVYSCDYFNEPNKYKHPKTMMNAYMQHPLQKNLFSRQPLLTARPQPAHRHQYCYGPKFKYED